VIKVSATGGVYGRLEGEEVGTAELTERELKAIRDEAHRFGLKVAAHAISEQGIENCIRSGIDTIEHGHFLTENQMGRMIEKGMWWTPTLFVYRQIAQGDTIPPYAMEKARRIVDIHRDAFRKAVARGVPIVAGSDAGSPNTPHTSLLNELECMEEYGYQPIEILRAATSRAAQALGMEAQIGSIEVGKKADLVVVSRNPLENITNLRNAVLVMKGGETLIRKATNKEQGLSLVTT
jgi:imidazolonepropionase-like amidohydrolase